MGLEGKQLLSSFGRWFGQSLMRLKPVAVSSTQKLGNAVHAVPTQCKLSYVGKYSNPSFGP